MSSANISNPQSSIDSRKKSLEIFGKPTISVETEGQDKINPEIWDEYTAGNEFYKSFTIVSLKKTKLVISVFATPKDSSPEKLVSFFGNQYKRTRYDFFECPGDTGSSKIIESPTGQLEYIEYRAKGIAINVKEEKVEDISFLSSSLGLKEPKCK